MREKIFGKEYNEKTKKFKYINLEKLAKESADFVKFLNFIFVGTPYKISEVRESRKKGNLNVYISLYEGNSFEESKDYGILLTNRGISVGDWSRKKLFSKDYEGLIKDYLQQ